MKRNNDIPCLPHNILYRRWRRHWTVNNNLDERRNEMIWTSGLDGILEILIIVLAGFILGILTVITYVEYRVKRQLDQVNMEYEQERHGYPESLRKVGGIRSRGYMDALRWVLEELLK